MADTAWRPYCRTSATMRTTQTNNPTESSPTQAKTNKATTTQNLTQTKKNNSNPPRRKGQNKAQSHQPASSDASHRKNSNRDPNARGSSQPPSLTKWKYQSQPIPSNRRTDHLCKSVRSPKRRRDNPTRRSFNRSGPKLLNALFRSRPVKGSRLFNSLRGTSKCLLKDPPYEFIFGQVIPTCSVGYPILNLSMVFIQFYKLQNS